jgi:CBS domain-containing protein
LHRIGLVDAAMPARPPHRRARGPEVLMKVNECMTQEVCLVSPQDSVRQAAEMMAEVDTGALPVGENDRLVGMVTDRDLAIRGLGKGRGPETTVAEVMTREIKYCYDTEDVDDVIDNMADLQLRRLPVLDASKRLVGIVSLSDLADEQARRAGKALGDIARPSALHSQRL